jgi:hypothetical protein
LQRKIQRFCASAANGQQGAHKMEEHFFCGKSLNFSFLLPQKNKMRSADLRSVGKTMPKTAKHFWRGFFVRAAKTAHLLPA